MPNRAAAAASAEALSRVPLGQVGVGSIALDYPSLALIRDRDDWQSSRPSSWMRTYVHQIVIADFLAALVAAIAAIGVRFGMHPGNRYLVLSLVLPLLWVIMLSVFGAYERRFLGAGSDEYRRVLNAGLSLIGAFALVSYAVNNELSRLYLVISMVAVVVLDLLVRIFLRKRLHRLRRRGMCMSTVVAVGHEIAVHQLIRELRREPHHGLQVVAACLAGDSAATEVAGVPVVGDLDETVTVVRNLNVSTVAVLSCPEMDGPKLRTLAWELEKTGTDLCVAPALLDVAGPRTTVRPTAGLTLLHVDHPQLSGPRQVVKELFDRCGAAFGLMALSPLMLAIAVAIRVSDGGPALFTQVRVGKDGETFKIYKFRTMAVDAEARLAEIRGRNESDGVLFKIRRDPRITQIGARLRRWSLDELPTLINVLKGEMSMVGPRPALPDEAAKYADHVRRRLVVKPGITGMWQVNGRSDLSWEETVRLDLRYVENWSFALDLQILWKTLSVIVHGSGAY
jgi:exopolysaccharide biosynthesis polyprenyl glycosylphosphotransferase